MTRRGNRGGELPLLAWGEQLRAGKDRDRWLRRRIAVVGAGIGLIALTIVAPPPPRLVWNASASAPTGLYMVMPGAPVDPGNMAVARLPAAWRMFAARRGYLPANVPLVKRVAAVAGDDVCASGSGIFVNGKTVTRRRATDAAGRRMPWWSGCVRLRARQLFLLMPDNAASFDGRYFGVTEGDQLVGKADLLWHR